jgi:hypothetical protein
VSVVEKVATLFPNGGYAPAGQYRPSDGGKFGPHPADGMTVNVSMGGGAYSTIINPQADTGPEWVMRYGSPEGIRYSVASILETYDYLLSDAINMKEATRRLRIMRAVRRALLSAKGGET